VWLDAERARRLLAPLGADLQQSAMPQTAPVVCPVCGHGMYVCLTRLAGVEIDVCGPHGVWFDRHELERVSHAVARISGQPVPQAPPGWTHAQPPAGLAGARGMGPGLAVGAAAVGAVAAGAVAYSALGGRAEQEAQRSSFEPIDALVVVPDVANTGFAVAESAGDAGELARDGASAAGDMAGGAADVAGDVLSGAAEVGADAAEAAGSILGGIFEAIGSIFS
jgi:Zn-finger nucleic acid-binding protein